MKAVILVVFFVALCSMCAAYATSYAMLHLDDTIGENIREDSTVMFSGHIITPNGTAVSHRAIFIIDDNSYTRPDTILAITNTDEHGKFSTTWKAEPKDNGHTYHFYALFVGGKIYGYARSETYESSVEPLSSTNIDQVKSKLPEWFKDSSQLWHDGQIKDFSYAYGISNLIDNQIIKNPYNQTTHNMTIPAWFKNNAGWFADGQISEDVFLNSIQYLINNQIIQV